MPPLSMTAARVLVLPKSIARGDLRVSRSSTLAIRKVSGRVRLLSRSRTLDGARQRAFRREVRFLQAGEVDDQPHGEFLPGPELLLGGVLIAIPPSPPGATRRLRAGSGG